jgi:hypothetical protein
LPEAVLTAAFGMFGVGSTEDAHLATVTRPNDNLRKSEFVAGVVYLTGDAIGVSGVSLCRPGGSEVARFTSLAGALQACDENRRSR